MKTIFVFLILAFSQNASAFGTHQAPTPSPTSTSAPVDTATPAITPAPSASPVSWWKTPYGVDLSKCDGPIENQQTPWCTAFSIVGILENMLCDHVRLSIHHTWSFYEEYSVETASQKVPGNKITTWDMWPENGNAKQGYLNFAKHQLNGMKEITTDDDISEVFKILDSGRPVYVGMAVPDDLASCYENIRATTKITDGGHALEIVGYGVDPKIPGGAYFRLKQSWGTDCGDHGYQNMPVSVCDKDGMYCEFFEPTSFTVINASTRFSISSAYPTTIDFLPRWVAQAA